MSDLRKKLIELQGVRNQVKAVALMEDVEALFANRSTFSRDEVSLAAMLAIAANPNSWSLTEDEITEAADAQADAWLAGRGKK